MWIQPDSLQSKQARFPWPLAVFAALLIALALAFLALHLATPFDNGRIAPRSNGLQPQGVLVEPLAGGPRGFLPGDLVTETQDASLEVWARRALTFNWQPPDLQIGQTAAYLVQRDRQLLPVQVVLEPYPLGQIFRAQWGTILFGLSFAAISWFVFLRRPYNLAARVLFLASSALFCATAWSLGLQISDFTGGLGLWLFYLCILPGFMLVWIAYFHFVLVFPTPLSITRQRWLLPLVYGLPYGLLVIYLVITARTADSALQWLAGVALPSDVTAIVFILLSIVTFIYQYRLAGAGPSRQQVRWLLLATLVVAGTAVLFYFLPPLLGAPAISANLVGLIGVLLPLAIAIAILRYNLFDIDVIIRRTLVYGTLSAALTGLFLVLVTLLQNVFSLVSNQQSPISIVISTLAIAALFNPLRSRVQRFIDRRFYRRHYDPEQVLAEFAALSRNEVEMASLTEALSLAVQQTVAPERIVILLKTAEHDHAGADR